MTAATTQVPIGRFGNDAVPTVQIPVPVAAATSIKAGWLVGLNAAGRAISLVPTTALVTFGVCSEDADNSTGAAGDISVKCQQGAYLFVNDSGTPVTQAMLGTTVYALDNQTVTGTGNAGANPVAGTFLGFVGAKCVVRILP